MEAAILRAAIPEPVQILGQKLRPFSFGHYYLFNRFELAFFKDRSPTLTDLTTGVLICSMTYEEGLEFFNDDANDYEIERFISQSALVNFDEKLAIFERYLTEALTFPDFYSTAEDGDLEAPWFQTIRVSLQTRMKLSDSEIFNRPLALCVWDFATIGEMDGVIKFGKKDYVELGRLAAKYAEEEGGPNGS